MTAIIFVYREPADGWLAACREFAKRRGFTVAAEVVTSFEDPEHVLRAMDEVTALLRRPEVDVLILSRLPRWDRLLVSLEPMLSGVRRGEITIVSPEGDLLSDELTRPRDTVWHDHAEQHLAADWRPATGLGRRADRETGTAMADMTLPPVPSGIREPAPARPGRFVAPGVPLRSRDTPLPHDGLFVRRNNAFGTRSTVGIRELIEQGVLIDQAHIRFDDFVVENADRIPLPPAGEAVAVSHGATAVTGSSKAHDATTHVVEIALRAGPPPPGTATGTATMPANVVFVVDTSASMAHAKLDTVRMAILALYGQLRDVDILGIVTFDTHVRTVLRATPKAQLDRTELERVVSGLRAHGGTDINLGVLYGIDEISRYGTRQVDVVNRLYLFSDGDPTSGETDWIRIRANLGARVRGDLTLSCFGFGTDARMRELDALAGISGGYATFVTQADDVALNLAEDLSRRGHLAALNVQLRLDIDADVVVWHLYGHDLITDPAARAAVEDDARAADRAARDRYGVGSLPDLVTEEKGIRLFAPDLAFGETYWIVLEVQAHDDRAFGAATVQYVDTVARDARRHHVTLGVDGTIPADTVLANAVGLWTSEVTFFALDDLYQNDRETAKVRLSRHIRALESAYGVVPLAQFQEDQVTVRKLMSLAGNLGLTVSYGEDPRARFTEHTMSAFGRVRGGFVRSSA